MRLLRADRIQLRSFEENAVPQYSILSHTWGTDEVSFQDIQGPHAASRAGYAKIRYACQDALQRGLEYVWVDTCCIDKTSSAELSEAINSMFRWYRNAKVCYAYLADVPAGDDVNLPQSNFARSRWFSRGWTLQELLAPSELYFFSSNGRLLGTKHDLSKPISDITGIGEKFLTGEARLSQASIARRMSWASRRETTRTEDIAYCLLGIFGISMPLLYGEGQKAFVRLQEEVMKNSDDQSLFAWGYHPTQDMDPHITGYGGPFATDPTAFRDSGEFIPDELDESITAYAITNKGLQINLPVIRLSRFFGGSKPLAVLACRPEKKFLWLVAIPILFHGSDSFTRFGIGECLIIRRDEVVHTPSRPLRFLSSLVEVVGRPEVSSVERSFIIRKLPKHDSGLCIWYVEPREAWDPEQRVFRIHEDSALYIVIRLWRSEGEGFAITIAFPEQSGFRQRRDFWSAVYRETSRHPLSYETLFPSPTHFASKSLENKRSSDIQVIIGDRDILMSTGLVVRTVDIEIPAHGSNDTDQAR